MGDWYPKITYGELVNRAAARFGDKEFMCFEGERWTFRQIRDEIDRVARGLIAVGVQPGDRVALWLPNRPEWVQAQFATLKIGAILVPVNTQVRAADLSYLLRQSETTVLIAPDVSGPVNYLEMVKEVCPELDAVKDDEPTIFAAAPHLRNVVLVSEETYRGTLNWSELIARGEAIDPDWLRAREAAVDPDATAMIMYTSGSTGAPKGVMHNHRTIRNASDQASRLGVRRDDVTMMYLPQFHAFGWCDGPLMSFVTGARMVLMSRFVPAEVLKLIEEEHCTLLHGFDTHFKDLMDHPDFQRRDVTSVRGGKFPAGLRGSEAMARRARTLANFVSGWSMTEMGPASSMGSPGDDEERSACASGFPMPGYEFKIIDPESGKEQPAGVFGEICCRSYAMMQGYYNKPEETGRTIDAEGWLHSGDMGRIGESGYLEFKGRYKEMLKVGGENVDPIEVEAHLTNLPGVNRVGIVGVHDDRLHEVAVACVIVAPDFALTAEQVMDHCRNIASFKRPRHVLFLDGFPMTATGKLQKFKLREIAHEMLGIPMEPS